MKNRFKITCAALLMAGAITANGQPAPDNNGGGPPNFQEMREMMMARLQKQLDMPDDTFTAIKPQLQKVMELKRDETAGMGGRGGPGGGGPGGGMGGPRGGMDGPDGGPGGGGNGPRDNGGGGGNGGPPPDMNGPGGGGGGGGGGNGGPPDMNGGPGGGGPGGDQPQSEVRKAQRDLRTAVRESSTDADSLKAKMQAYRDARAKNHTNLLAAETELKSVLSVKQEAILLSMGILD